MSPLTDLLKLILNKIKKGELYIHTLITVISLEPMQQNDDGTIYIIIICT